MKIKDMGALRGEIYKIENVDMLSTGNEKDRIKFFKKLSKTMISAGELNFSDSAMLEVALILRHKGIVRSELYYKANKIRPSKNIFEIMDAKSSEFPALVYSTIAFGTESDGKDCMNAFRGRDSMMSKWVQANKSLDFGISM